MRQLVISESDNIAALIEDGKAIDFYISKNEYGVGDVYSVVVENIMPSINAVFVKLAEGQMGFLHANDIPGRGTLYERLNPGQRLLVQIVKEPTGNKGPRVNLSISIAGRYFVLTTENNSIAISRRISENAERDRLRSITNLMKPEELGAVIRTEAAGRSQEELEEDFLNIWEKWKNIVEKYDRCDSYSPIYKESDFLYTTLRDAFNNTIDEVVVGSIQSKYRCQEYLTSWTGREVNIAYHDANEILSRTDVLREIRNCLSNRVNLPSGGYIVIQGMEALTAIDINSGKFTSSATLRETVRRTNMEAAVEIARQMRLRNIGGMIIIDFIDMADRADRISVMEILETAIRHDKAKPQIGQLSDLCLVEITRKRSGQALAEIFGNTCQHCSGSGVIFNLKGDDTHTHSSNNRFKDRDHGDRDRRNQGARSSHNRNDNRERHDNRDRSDNRDRPDNRENRDRLASDRSEHRGQDNRDRNDNRGSDNRDRNDNRDRGDNRDRNDRNRRNPRSNNNRYNQRGPRPSRPPGEATEGGEPKVAVESPLGTGADMAVATARSEARPEKSIPKYSESDFAVSVDETSKLTKSKSFGNTHAVEADFSYESKHDTD